MGMAEEIKSLIQNEFCPAHLEVVNDSHLHSGHAGDDKTGETHFRIMIVSEKYKEMSRIQRHREVYELLQRKMKRIPHSLSIKALSPEEWKL